MTETPTKFTVFQADAFFVLAFKAVDLALTKHCGNTHHLLLLLDPQTALTYCISKLQASLVR